MTIATWPVDLPRPNRQGYQAQYQDPRLKRAADAGPPGYRRRFSSVSRNVQLVIDASRAQKAVFDTFFHAQGFGTAMFWMPDPTTDGWPMLTAEGQPVQTAEGTPVLLSAQWLCLFGDAMPTETVIGVRFQISFSVSVMP